MLNAWVAHHMPTKFGDPLDSMIKERLLPKKRSKRLLLLLVTLAALFFGGALAVAYIKQDAIVASQVDALNQEHVGVISIADSHLAPFRNFPYVSLRMDSVRILETKAADAPVILDVADIYLGFSLWDVLRGDYDIKTLIIENGFFNLVLHEDGTTNIQNALATADDVEETDALNIHLKKIRLVDVDIHKLNESTATDIETYVYSGKGGFKTGGGLINAHVDADFQLNVIQDGDTTYINHKEMEVHTDLTFDENTGMLTFRPSKVRLEHSDFDVKGTVDTKNDMSLDLDIKGTKSNFDMLIAFAPHDLIPVLERYQNAGKIYFNAVLQGPSTGTQFPFFDVQFGASDAFLENVVKGRRVDNLGFQGHVTNGKERHMRSTEFSLTGITANLEQGNVTGDLVVKNFLEPDVDMQVKAEFDMEFLSEFSQVEEISEASGKVSAEVRFHDIIDLDNPETALQEFNQAYFMELLLDGLSFDAEALPAPVASLDAHMIMRGKRMELDTFEMVIGNSDISMTGYLSDLPAVVHHTNIPVKAHLDIQSKKLDITELTEYSAADSTGIDEQLEDLVVGFSFHSSARAFTESKYLPTGEFFVDSFHARLKHYPHELHDFHADVLIDDTDLQVVDFTGHLDDSDFHLGGVIHDYGFWFQPELNGDVDLDLTLESDLLRLEDILVYKGENHVPEDYRHEEFDKLVLHVNTSMHYRDSELSSIDIDLDRLSAKMHVHPMRFEDFRGRIHYEDDHIQIEKLHGQIGATRFDMDMNYYLGKDEAIKKRDNHIGVNASYIHFDQLTNYNPAPSRIDTSADSLDDVAEHAEAFNIYELPFTDMTLDLDIDHFMYHGLDLENIHARLRTTHDHYLYVDTLRMKAAGGYVYMSGYFNGSDPDHIYLKPDLVIKDADIDKLMFKFERLGHDLELSKNLHGILSATAKGNIRVYPDLVPDLDQSEIHMDVMVLNGRLVNYEPMLLLAEYMGNKDLTNIRFDTITNHMDLTAGTLSIPNMNIESTLGHYELSGTHDLQHNIEYYLRIPWKTVREGARTKLFGPRKVEDVDDEIVEKDPNKKVNYLNVKIHGTLEDYKIGLGKKRR